MAQRSGIAAQLGLAAESTYGTRVAPSRFLEFRNESLAMDIARVESEALRVNQRILRSDHWAAGRKNVSGDIEMDLPNKGGGLLLKHALGAVATSADGTGWKHSCTLADPFGLSFSIQVGKPGTDGTSRPFDYLGCVIESWELSCAVDQIATLKLGLNGRDLDTAQTLASPSAPTLTELFVWNRGSVSIGGSTVKAKSFTLTGNMGIDTDRYFVQTSGDLKAAPIQASMVEVTGEITMEFEDLTQLNRFLTSAVAAIDITCVTVSTYDTAKPFKLQVTIPAARFDGADPSVSGPGIVELTLPFKVVDSAGSPLTIDYYTSDAAP